MAPTVRKSKDLTLRDRLSRLTFEQAVRILGGNEEGRKLLYAGGRISVEDIDTQVALVGDLFRLSLPTEEVIVTITLRAEKQRRLLCNCDGCIEMCVHIGAALAFILESKTVLGLAIAPPERLPIQPLSDEELIERALAERQQRATEEKMVVTAADTESKSPWGDYLVTSKLSGKTYRVALRGMQRGDSYCTCPDFRTNTLGTCKHVLHALAKVRRRFPANSFNRKPKLRETSVYLKYGAQLALRLGTPDKLNGDCASIVGPLQNVDIDDVSDLLKRLDKLEGMGERVLVYPDAEEFIQQQLFRQRIRKLVCEIRQNPRKHPLRTTLLKAELLPHQMDGIAFAAGAGRAVLADDMGLGKTIQGVGLAELLAREAGIQRVLIICPTSLKSQWRTEIHRFSSRDCQLVVGNAQDRGQQYCSPAFFTICNYEQVLRDIQWIESAPWDLIILDEGQRIKNWEAQTTRIVKSLKSPFALVLSGTPLENRLDELYSVVQFVDDRILGPGFRFFNRYRIQDEKGYVLGYQHLDELRDKLKHVLLRRTREQVLRDLPPRNMQFVKIPPTSEQRDLHVTHARIVASIVRKPYISEMDLLRLRQALLMCRMSADSSILVDKKSPGSSTKLQYLDELFEQLFVDGDHKAVVFSEWVRMLDLIEPLLTHRGIRFVRLDGKVPQKKRQQLVNDFQNNPDCRVFLSTNAGGTGLNLQAADTVINVDLPWNPAVLEQRIARAHRMGQTRPINVYVLVTEETFEEQLLTTIGQKKELALAALDYESDITEVNLQSGMEALKARLEVLLGAVPEGFLDESQKRQREDEVGRIGQRKGIADAGGQLLTAAFSFLSELLPGGQMEPQAETVTLLRDTLSGAAETDEHGNKSLRIQLPSEEALTQFASTLARLMAFKKDS